MDKRIANKKVVLDFAKSIREGGAAGIQAAVDKYCHKDVIFHGAEPWNDIRGSKDFVEKFWLPFYEGFEDLEKQPYMLLAGEFNHKTSPYGKASAYVGEHAGDDWVSTSGNYIGNQNKSWIGIPPSMGAKWIRYGEFSRVVDGKIKEIFAIIDVLDAMRQAGYTFLDAVAPEMIIPGPATFDGIIEGASDPVAGKKSIDLVEEMCFVGLTKLSGDMRDKAALKKLGMEKYWHKDMMWYGPAGVGTTRSVAGFQTCHQGRFLKAFPDRVGGHHFARFAEDNYCVSGGWPSIHCTHKGEWQGKTATNLKLTQRVMDFWRRDGEMLVENWVFIDVIHLLKQIDFNVFEILADRVRRNVK